MPRRPRMYLPDIPAHVVQRGNNRCACFYCDDDYRYYLDQLRRGLRRFGVALHAYVLMTNHVHLLMTPVDSEGISRLMQHLGRHYVPYVNKTYERTGTLWEGRHHASLVQADEYLMACMRYIEWNPVAANIVRSPEQYPWSSFRHNALGEPDRIITYHGVYRALGRHTEERQAAYRSLFPAGLPDSMLETISGSLAINFPVGNDRFRRQIEKALGRSLGFAKRGRPVEDAPN